MSTVLVAKVYKIYFSHHQLFHTIKHIGESQHWVCTAVQKFKMRKENEVVLLDSLWNVDTLERLVGLQIAQIYGAACALKRGLTIRKLNVQQQKVGTQDCGLFAVAYATEVCYGMDPTMASFEQSKMNIHLLKCLEEGRMARFPQTCKERTGLRPANSIAIHLPLYCYCIMPDNYDNMIECHHCKLWFHKSCAGINGLTRRQLKQLHWFCEPCKGGSSLSPSTCAQRKPEEFLPKYPAKKHSKKAAGNILSIPPPHFAHVLMGRYAFSQLVPSQVSLKLLTMKDKQQVKQMQDQMLQDELEVTTEKTATRKLKSKYV